MMGAAPLKVVLSSLLMMLAACSTSKNSPERFIDGEIQQEPLEQRTQEHLMEEIERAVSLPPGASPLSAYGRNYAYFGRDFVRGEYLIPDPPMTESTSCSHWGGVPCTKEEVQEMIKSDKAFRATMASAGERRWFKSVDDLPGVNDGGCIQITVEYHIPTRSVLFAACNGPY
jgi:major membrane immunogen (membrane-anchored lipoprotein)